MDQATHNKIVSFIWGIAEDVLRNQFKCGKDPDEILPMCIKAFIRHEVLPYTPGNWVKGEATMIGYEISFGRHFHKPQPLLTLKEIRADILAVQKEAEGVLDELLKGGANP
jgi:hypothetical protein